MADRYKWRHHKDGFVRIVPTRRRYRDDAPMAFIEFIDREGEIYKAKPTTENPEWYPEKKYKPIKKYKEQLLIKDKEEEYDQLEDGDDDQGSRIEKLQ